MVAARQAKWLKHLLKSLPSKNNLMIIMQLDQFIRNLPLVTRERIRRSYRLCLFLILVLTLRHIVVVEYFNTLAGELVFEFATSSSVEIDTSGCDVAFETNSAISHNIIRVTGEFGHDSAITFRKDSEQVLIFGSRPDESFFVCNMTLAFHPATLLPPTTVRLAESSHTSTLSSPRAAGLDFGPNSIVVNGTNGGVLDVVLSNVHAASVVVKVVAGVVELPGLRANSVELSSGNGDISVTMAESAFVSYSHPAGMYCLSAANVTVLSEVCASADLQAHNMSNSSFFSGGTSSLSSHAPAATPLGNASAAQQVGSTTGVVSCVGESLLCTRTDPSCDVQLLPRLTVSTADGGVYVNVGVTRAMVKARLEHLRLLRLHRSAAAALNGSFVNASRWNITGLNFSDPVLQFEGQTGPGMSTAMSFDSSGLFRLQEIRRWLAESPFEDAVVTVDMRRSPGNAGFWIFATRQAYLQMEPWMLSAFSATLIKPRLLNIPARLLPGMCPYIGPLQEDWEYGRVWSALGSTLAMLPTDGLVLKRQRRRPVPSGWGWLRGPWYTPTPFRLDSTEVKHTFSMLSTGEFVSRPVSLDQSASLRMAITFSVVLAVIVALLGIASALAYSKLGVGLFWKRLKHQAAFKKLKQKRRSPGAHRSSKAKPGLSKGLNTLKKLGSGPRVKMPHPFAVPDILIDALRRRRAKSLRLFLLQHCEEETGGSEREQSVDSRAFKELYEAFCFTNGFKEQSVPNKKKLLAKFGMRYVSVRDASTDAFRCLRFMTTAERAEADELRPLPNEDSLSFFVRKRCVVTPFEQDFILVKALTREYETFCKLNRGVSPVPISKRAMRAMGVVFERITQHAIKANGKWRVQLKPDPEQQQRIEAAKIDPTPPMWYLYDVVTVIVHFGACVGLVLPLWAIAFFSQMEFSQTSTYSPRSLLWDSDLLYRHSSLSRLLWFMEPLNVVVLLVGLGFIVLMVVELILYYSTQKFTVKEQSAEVTGALRHVLHAFIFAYALLIVGAYAGYVGLAAVWSILAAVLNPQVFLPHAAAVATMVAFVLARIALLGAIHRKVQRKVGDSVHGRLVDMLKDTMTKVQASSPAGVDMATTASKKGDLGGVAGVIAGNAALASLVAGLGIDVELAFALATGDPEAVQAMATRLGMPAAIMRAVLAVGRKEQAAINASVAEVAAMDGIDIPPKTAQVLIDLARNQDDRSLRLAVKTAVVHVLRIARQEMRQQGVQLPSDDLFNAHTVDAIISVSRGDISRVVSIVQRVPALLRFSAFADMLLCRSQTQLVQASTALASKVLQLPPYVFSGVAALVHGEEERVDALQPLADMLGLPLSQLQLLLAVSQNDPNKFRNAMPGFSSTVSAATRVELSETALAAFSALVRGTNVNVKALAEAHEVEEDAALAVAHTVVGDVGDDGPMLGLIRRSDHSHLSWLASRLQLEPAVLVGFLALARQQLDGESAPARALTTEFCVRVGLNDDSQRLAVRHVLVLCGSTNKEQLRKAMAFLKLTAPVELVMLTRGLVKPKQFFASYTKKLGLPKNHPIVKRARVHGFDHRDPAERAKWMRTLCAVVRTMSVPTARKRSLQALFLLGQSFPSALLTPILQSKLGSDANTATLRNLGALGNVACFSQLKPIAQQSCMNQLDRLLELNAKVLTALIDTSTALLPADRLQATLSLLRSLDLPPTDTLPLLSFASSLHRDFLSARASLRSLPMFSRQLHVPPFLLEFVTRGIVAPVDGVACDPALLYGLRSLLSSFDLSSDSLEIALLAIAKQNPGELSPLSQALGLSPTALTLATQLFGSCEHDIMVQNVSVVLQAVNGTDTQVNNARGLAALTAHYQAPFELAGRHKKFGKSKGRSMTRTGTKVVPITPLASSAAATGGSAMLGETKGEVADGDSDGAESGSAVRAGGARTVDMENSENRKRASAVLAKPLGVPAALLDGIVSTHLREQRQAKEALLQLVSDEVLLIDENVCRGLISLATGDVDSIEDIAAALKFDADLAEGLAFVASSVTIAVSYNSLRSSSALQKLCSKMGLDMATAAALLAVVNQDFHHGQEINEDLTLVEIDGRILKAILSVYSDEDAHTPRTKTGVVSSSIGPLALLYGVTDSDMATALVRLVQGDATVVQNELGERMGWSKRERDILTALVVLAQRYPLDMSPAENPDWDAKRDAGVASGMLAAVLNTPSEVVELLVGASRGNPPSLERLADAMQLQETDEVRRRKAEKRGLSTARKVALARRVVAQAMGDELDSDDDSDEDDDDGDGEGDEGDGDNGVQELKGEADDDRQSLSGKSEVTDMEMRDGDESAFQAQLSSLNVCATALAKLAEGINSLVLCGTEAVDESVLRWLLMLPKDWRGDADTVLPNLLRNLRGGEVSPAVNNRMIRELLCVATGRISTLLEMERLREVVEMMDTLASEASPFGGKGGAQRSGGDNGGEEEDSGEDGGGMLAAMGFGSISSQQTPGLLFLLKLAKGDVSAWAVEGPDGVVSSKIHPDTRIVTALAGLAANDLRGVKDSIPVLCDALEVDSALVLALLSLSVDDEASPQPLERVVQDVAKIMGVDAQFAKGFVAGASIDKQFLLSVLGPMSDRLGVDTRLTAAIVLVMQCMGSPSTSAWADLAPFMRVKRSVWDDSDDDDEGGGEELSEEAKALQAAIRAVTTVVTMDRVRLHSDCLHLDSLLGMHKLNTRLVSASNSTLTSMSELLVGVAVNDKSMLRPVLTLANVPVQNFEMVEAVLNIFNRTPGALSAAASLADTALAASAASAGAPRGLFMAMSGALAGSLDVFAEGMSRALTHHPQWKRDAIPGLPQMLVSMRRRDLFQRARASVVAEERRRKRGAAAVRGSPTSAAPIAHLRAAASRAALSFSSPTALPSQATNKATSQSESSGALDPHPELQEQEQSAALGKGTGTGTGRKKSTGKAGSGKRGVPGRRKHKSRGQKALSTSPAAVSADPIGDMFFATVPKSSSMPTDGSASTVSASNNRMAGPALPSVGGAPAPSATSKNKRRRKSRAPKTSATAAAMAGVNSPNSTAKGSSGPDVPVLSARSSAAALAPITSTPVLQDALHILRAVLDRCGVELPSDGHQDLELFLLGVLLGDLGVLFALGPSLLHCNAQVVQEIVGLVNSRLVAAYAEAAAAAKESIPGNPGYSALSSALLREVLSPRCAPQTEDEDGDGEGAAQPGLSETKERASDGLELSTATAQLVAPLREAAALGGGLPVGGSMLTVEIMEALLSVVSGGVLNLGSGRKGISVQLHTIATTFLDADDVRALDALFLAATDAPTNMPLILASVPHLTHLLLGDDCPAKLVSLITGIIGLCSAQDSKAAADAARSSAVLDLGVALGIRKSLVRGLLGLATSDVAAMEHMAQAVGEFDVRSVTRLLQLVRRLSPVIQEGLGGSTQGDESGAGEPMPTPEEAAKMSHADLFRVFDRDNSGFIDMDEFKGLAKYFGLNLSEQRCLQLFSACDGDGSGLIASDEFDNVMNAVEKGVENDILSSLGLTKSALAGVFLGSVTVLAFLFVFIFFGISGFSKGGGFGSVVNSIIPMAVGGGMGGGGEAAADEDSVDQKIPPLVNKAMSTLQTES